MKTNEIKKLRFKNNLRKIWSRITKKSVIGYCPLCGEEVNINWRIGKEWFDCCVFHAQGNGDVPEFGLEDYDTPLFNNLNDYINYRKNSEEYMKKKESKAKPILPK